MYAKNAIEMGLDISYETVRSWVLKFGPVIARSYQTLCAASTYSYSPDRSRAGRRVGLVAAGSGESLLSDHIAGAEPGRRQRSNLPLSRHSLDAHGVRSSWTVSCPWGTPAGSGCRKLQYRLPEK
jgi:hypothetical protein